jgi:hypothetical protein
MEPSSADQLTIERLERWALFGAHWRLVEASPGWALVDLCACTGELVQRVECGDVAVIEYVRARGSDEG